MVRLCATTSFLHMLIAIILCPSTKQNEALAKYESVWARYEVVYNSMEEIQELKQKKMVLHTLTKQSKN